MTNRRCNSPYVYELVKGCQFLTVVKGERLCSCENNCANCKVGMIQIRGLDE